MHKDTTVNTALSATALILVVQLTLEYSGSALMSEGPDILLQILDILIAEASRGEES